MEVGSVDGEDNDEIGAIVGKELGLEDKLGTIDGTSLSASLGTNDRFDPLGSSDGSEVGTIDGAPLGSSVGKTVRSRVGKVLGTIDG